MKSLAETRYTAFQRFRRVARGSLKDVVLGVKPAVDRNESDPVLIFDDETGEPVEIDFRGTADDVLARLSPGPVADVPEVEKTRGPGRPRLGVVAREVTLLPRHWEWLNGQPGGASVALRKLVDEARRANEGKDRVRLAKEAAYRFLSAVGGNLPGFEDATRALFASDAGRFDEAVAGWPADVRDHARRMAAGAFGGAG